MEIKVLDKRNVKPIKKMISDGMTLCEIADIFAKQGFQTRSGKKVRNCSIRSFLLKEDSYFYRNKCRLAETDVPRRIYRSTIDRIDKHLEARQRPVVTGIRKTVKGDFNKFLVEILDWYEKSERNGVSK